MQFAKGKGMSQIPTDFGAERAQLRAARSFLLLTVSLLAVLGFAVLWWWSTHPDKQGRIPQPSLAVQVPKLLVQFTGRQDGLHCIVLPGYGRKWSLAFERRFRIGESTYQRAWNGTLLGVRFVSLTREIYDGDMSFRPFRALILPHQFLMIFSGCLSAYFLYSLRFWVRETRRQRELERYEFGDEES